MADSDTTAVRLSNLQTEGRNVQSSNIDIVPTIELCSEFFLMFPGKKIW